MKLTIVAATGGIDRQLLEQAVAARHVPSLLSPPPHCNPGERQ